jgi:hypothetical protein
MLSKNEQGFANVCGTSSVQANSEAAEVADEIDRMIDRLSTKSNLRPPIFFSGDRATFAACPSIGWDALSTQELKGSERKRKKCYKI